jgi:hypothetical protein
MSEYSPKVNISSMNFLPSELYVLILKNLDLQNRQAFFVTSSDFYRWGNNNNNWFCLLSTCIDDLSNCFDDLSNCSDDLLYYNENINYRNLYYFCKFTEAFLEEDYDKERNYENKYMSLYLFLRNNNAKIETHDQIKMTLKDAPFDDYVDEESLGLRVINDIVSLNNLVLYDQMIDELKKRHITTDFLHRSSRYAAYTFRANNILSRLNSEISFDDWLAECDDVVLFSSLTESLLEFLLKDINSPISDDFGSLNSRIGTEYFTVYIFELYCIAKNLITLQDILENPTISEFIDIDVFSKMNKFMIIGEFLSTVEGALYVDKIKLQDFSEDMLLDIYSRQHKFETLAKDRYNFHNMYR